MKRVLYSLFSVIAMIFIVACSETPQQEPLLIHPTPKILREIQSQIDLNKDYDVEQVEAMLSDKEWFEWSHLHYTEVWESCYLICCYKGEMSHVEGYQRSRFFLHQDGSATNKLAGEAEISALNTLILEEASWNFNPQTREFTFISHLKNQEDGTTKQQSITYTVAALNNEMMVLESEKGWERIEMIVIK